MGLGQMMLAFCASVLLSLLILNINRNSIMIESSMSEYKIKELEINIAQSIIDYAQNKTFDALGSARTSWQTLGCETGENPNNYYTFDDFDDFDDYTNTVTSDTVRFLQGSSIPTASFRVKCSVKYVDFSNLNQPVNNETLYKRLEVRVWSDAFPNPITSVPDTVKLYSICGYWP